MYNPAIYMMKLFLRMPKRIKQDFGELIILKLLIEALLHVRQVISNEIFKGLRVCIEVPEQYK